MKWGDVKEDRDVMDGFKDAKSKLTQDWWDGKELSRGRAKRGRLSWGWREWGISCRAYARGSSPLGRGPQRLPGSGSAVGLTVSKIEGWAGAIVGSTSLDPQGTRSGTGNIDDENDEGDASDWSSAGTWGGQEEERKERVFFKHQVLY